MSYSHLIERKVQEKHVKKDYTSSLSNFLLEKFTP